MAARNTIGILGLGVMGASLARNFASKGFAVAGYNRNPAVGRALAEAHPEAHLDIAEELPAFVASIQRPRTILLMVQAGAAVDQVLAQLDPLLEAGDRVLDAGNSLYRDTERRLQAWHGRPWIFLGMGVSGGEAGALYGPSMMPGGDPAAVAELLPLLERVAAQGESGPCVASCGQGAAGHFVKMVHNGIEYGDMQLIAEVVLLLRRGLGLDAFAAADVFGQWNAGPLGSYLVEITADVLSTRDPLQPGTSLVDAILDQAGQKGTGSWTLMAAAELGVPVPTIAAAVDARSLSASRGLRQAVAQRFPREGMPLLELTRDDLESALYAAKIVSYAQGFALLRKASAQLGYGTNLAQMARIWTAGCIIRARFLKDVFDAFVADPDLELLVLHPFFAEALRRYEPAWRRVVHAAVAAGLPVPGLSASLAWFDTLRNSAGSAAIIQAQRDCFGAHTFERLDAPGIPVHASWDRWQAR